MKFMLWSAYLIQVLFFTGLLGCSVVVVLSWISVLRSALSNKDEV
jgi:hypothetical protein